MSEKTFQADIKRQLKGLGFEYLPEIGQACCAWDDAWGARYFIQFSASNRRGFSVQILKEWWADKAPRKPTAFIVSRLWKAVDRLESIGFNLLDWRCPD